MGKLLTTLRFATATMLLTAATWLAVPAIVSAQADGPVNTGTVSVPTEQPGNNPAPSVTPSPTPTTEPTDPALQTMLNSLCAGANFEVNSSCTTGSISGSEVQERFTRLIRSVVNIFSIVVGVVAVFMIIIGGLRYITSGGDSSNVSSAKNTILYVLVGLTVVAMSQVLVRFVITRLSSVQ